MVAGLLGLLSGALLLVLRLRARGPTQPVLRASSGAVPVALWAVLLSVGAVVLPTYVWWITPSTVWSGGSGSGLYRSQSLSWHLFVRF